MDDAQANYANRIEAYCKKEPLSYKQQTGLSLNNNRAALISNAIDSAYESHSLTAGCLQINEFNNKAIFR